MTTQEEKDRFIATEHETMTKAVSLVADLLVPSLARQAANIAIEVEGGDPPDTTPPKVGDVTLIPSPTSIRATFTTDEPAMVTLKAGDLDPVHGTELRTEHDLTVEGLAPSSYYVVTIWAEDSQGNRGAAWVGGARTESSGGGSPTDVVTDHGVKWLLGREAEVGRFVGGSPWVVGPVTVSGITPRGTDRNGSMRNPQAAGVQGYGTAPYLRFDPGLNVSQQLPLSLVPGDSLVSSVFPATPYPNSVPALDSASILTVVASPPAPNSFRPGTAGREAPRYTTDDLRMDKLQRLRVVDDAPDFDKLASTFARPWLDHVDNWTGRFLHPAKHMPNYGREISYEMGRVALAVNCDIPLAQKLPLVVGLVQWGLDLWNLIEHGGARWGADGGHSSGRLWPVLFAGLMLDDEAMQQAATRTAFGEIQQTYYITQADINRTGHPQADLGKPMWGARHAYAPDLDRLWGADAYQLCCTANVWHGWILAAMAMGAESLIQHPPLVPYMRRYVEKVTVANGSPGWHAAWGDGWALRMWLEHA